MIRSILVNRRAGVHLFLARYQRRLGPEIDSLNSNIAGRLTKQAKQNIEDTRLRGSERGSRPRSRLTGTLTGHSGRSSAIQGNALNRGRTATGKGRQGKGVGWPRVDILERRARHWRALEFGTPYVTMPRGLFLRGGTPTLPGPRNAADIFMTYREYIRKQGLRRGTTRFTRRQSRARRRRISPSGLRGSSFLVGQNRRGSGIEAKHFLENAWDEIVGPDGSRAFNEQVAIIDKVFRDFQRG